MLKTHFLFKKLLRVCILNFAFTYKVQMCFLLKIYAWRKKGSITLSSTIPAILFNFGDVEYVPQRSNKDSLYSDICSFADWLIDLKESCFHQKQAIDEWSVNFDYVNLTLFYKLPGLPGNYEFLYGWYLFSFSTCKPFGNVCTNCN